MPIRQYDIARLRSPFKLNFAEGRLQVTNKRVLFRTSGRSIIGPTSSQYEFGLEEIAGIELRKEARFNFAVGIFWLLVTALIYWITNDVFVSIGSKGFVSNIVAIAFAAASIAIFLFLPKKAELRHLILSLFAVFAIVIQESSSFIGVNELSIFERLSSTIITIAYVINILLLILSPNLIIAIKTKGGTSSIEIRRKKAFGDFKQEGTGFAQVMPGPDFDIAVKELGALIREVQQTGGISNV